MYSSPFVVRPDDEIITQVLSAFGITDLTIVHELTIHTLLEHRTWARLDALRPRFAELFRPSFRRVWDVQHDEASSMVLLRHFLRLVQLCATARWRYCHACGRDRVYSIVPTGVWTGMRIIPGPVRVVFGQQILSSC